MAFWTTCGSYYFHEIDGVTSERYENNLHYEYIKRLPAEEHVDIASQKNNKEKFLRSIGESFMTKVVPMTFLLATIFSSSIRTAIKWRKSPMNWKMSILHVLFRYYIIQSLLDWSFLLILYYSHKYSITLIFISPQASPSSTAYLLLCHPFAFGPLSPLYWP